MGLAFTPTRLNDLVVDVSLSGVAQGDILYRGASKWNNLAPGNAGDVLTSGGAGASPSWAAASGAPFTDSTAIVKGSVDATKLLRFEVDGFTAGATRVLTPPNADATIAGLGVAQTFTAAQTFGTGASVLVYDSTAVTGATSFIVRAGAGDGGNRFFAVRNSSNNDILVCYGNGVVAGSQYNDPGGVFKLSSAEGGLTIYSGGILGFGTVSSPTTTLRYVTTDTITLRGDSATGVSSTLQFQGKSSTTSGRATLDIATSWATSTDASRKARAVFNAYDTAARECIRIEASGSAPMVGFFGSAAVIQQAGTGEATGFTAGAGTTVTDQSTFTGNVGSTAYRINDVVKALKNLGLLAS